MRPNIPAILSALFLPLLAVPAAAQDYLTFQAPSGNIHCQIVTGEWSEARCDILEATRSFTRTPSDCELDWGYSFAVGPSGAGVPICVGDTVADRQSPILGYGETITLGDFACTSERTGMTCTNAYYGGFTVARAGQQVF